MADVVVRADDDKSDKAKEIEEALKADKARKDAEADDKLNKLHALIEGLTTGMNTILDRMDALEKDDDEEEEDMPGEPKPMKVDSDATESEFAAAQSKADSIASLHGRSAPRPLDGETLLAYRRRLLRPYLQFSDAFKGADLAVISVDKAAFDGIEAKVYADAEEAGRNPRVPEFQLRERTRTVGGHTYTEFHGDPRAWMSAYSGIGQAVTGFGPTSTK